MTETETVDFIAHPDLQVRDLSYSRSRMGQLVDLTKGSFFDMGFGPQNNDADPGDDEGWPRDRIEIYIKEKSRGPGYVCDIVYRSEELPVIVYAVLVNRGSGLEIAELELFRTKWGCWDDHDNYLQPDEQRPPSHEPAVLITSDVLRRIPLGDIIARVEQDLPDESWRTKGIPVMMGSTLTVDDLTAEQRRALENTTTIAMRRRGRPGLDDDLLIEVSEAYIAEAQRGKGALRRLAQTFDRPEPTIRDWIAAARRRGFLAPAEPGRRGVAAPGPNLPIKQDPCDGTEIQSATQPDLSRSRRRTIMRMIEGQGLLDHELSEDARLLYIIGGLICNAVGVAKTQDLEAALENPEIISVALEILDKAQRRHAARKRQ
ncbi:MULTISPECIES: hypothetical protein [Nocardia]|uniref:hypothetical protein n=1 Tax=Nocardia abscessus TaxID=120957 RepID=UPI0018962ADB|nr:hypothetical protein [Nocardia abscessus]MBF6474691.1 hypothetical protein [Nocardia abscessus]